MATASKLNVCPHIDAKDIKGACELVAADGFLSESEIWRLADWIEAHPETSDTTLGKTLIRSINSAISDGKIEPDEIAKIALAVVAIRDARPADFFQEYTKVLPVKKREGFLSGIRTWIAQKKAENERQAILAQEAFAERNLAIRANAARIVQRLKDGHFLQVQNFIPKRGENVCYETQGQLHETKVTKREYVGGSRSTRIRVAKGVSFSVGGSRGELIQHEGLVPVARGQVLITTKQLVFLGDAKSFSLDLAKLLSIEISPNGMKFPAPRTGKPSLIFFDKEDGDNVVAVLNFLLGGTP